jgi:hypothetical protein
MLNWIIFYVWLTGLASIGACPLATGFLGTRPESILPFMERFDGRRPMRGPKPYFGGFSGWRRRLTAFGYLAFYASILILVVAELIYARGGPEVATVTVVSVGFFAGQSAWWAYLWRRPRPVAPTQ